MSLRTSCWGAHAGRCCCCLASRGTECWTRKVFLCVCDPGRALLNMPSIPCHQNGHFSRCAAHLTLLVDCLLKCSSHFNNRWAFYTSVDCRIQWKQGLYYNLEELWYMKQLQLVMRFYFGCWCLLFNLRFWKLRITLLATLGLSKWLVDTWLAAIGNEIQREFPGERGQSLMY